MQSWLGYALQRFDAVSVPRLQQLYLRRLDALITRLARHYHQEHYFCFLLS